MESVGAAESQEVPVAHCGSALESVGAAEPQEVPVAQSGAAAAEAVSYTHLTLPTILLV